MLILEALLKFGSVGVMCALGILLLRDARGLPALRFALPLLVTLICMLLTTGSDDLRLTGAIAVPLRLIDTFSSLFIWWLGQALFDEEFELGVFEWSVAGVIVAIGVPVKLYYLGLSELWFPGMEIVSSGLVVLMMLHLAYRALLGRNEDLLEKRRRVRVWFSIAIATVLVMSVLAERMAALLDANSHNTIWITYVFTFPIVIWAVLWLTRLSPDALAFRARTNDVGLAPASAIDPRDAEIHAKLVEFMEVERGFTEHGLTIGSLASKVGLPAHQLRALINRSMGYQNFSAFLNHYRIRDVKRALADPKNGRTPILTLAMDAGYSSLAPFNRAFKKSVGTTPTEYRTDLLDKKS